ncbi:MAG: hypothetical protein MJ123_01750 [Lachnospiraceae bacterium]|nr:hypothetical protein [Lachnospiraceae bacterium]
MNYRFGAKYTEESLTTSMKKKYMNGDGGIPNMEDYKNFTNSLYNAGVDVYSSLPFSSLKKAINAKKPVMGSWYSGKGSNKEWHAIIIAGYIENSKSNYTYYLRNPWYDYVQTITVTNAKAVVYKDSGYTWNLSQNVY